jgi:hypothetical protein
VRPPEEPTEEPIKEERPDEEGVDPPRLALLLLVLFPFLLVIVLGLLYSWIGR